MVNMKDISKEELDRMEAERAEALEKASNGFLIERRTLNPVINEMRFYHNYLYIAPYLFDNDTYGKFEIYPFDDKKVINIAFIGVNEEDRQKGIGTKMMSLITELADKYGYQLTLTIDPKFGVKKRVLNKFYKSHGFVWRYENNKDMIRYPILR